jgi:hypothetical protein
MVPLVIYSFNRGPEDSWEPLYDWFRETGTQYATFTIFSSDHRRNFCFADLDSAMLFKLSFHGVY